MQELRFVAVSEDGSYAVLAVPGRSARFTLPIDERLRAVALGQTSRLAQYEIEVESPLRPKEIQARIRAGETAEEIADAAGIPVERVRWFEGPVLAERGYIANQAQAATVRRQGDSSGPGPRLSDIVPERLSAAGADPDDGEWDSRKRGDGNWQVQLTFSAGGRLHIAEWIFDPRRRHVMPDDDLAGRLSLPESELPPLPVTVPGEATVTSLAPRLGAAAGMGAAPIGGLSGGAGSGRFRSERPGELLLWPSVPLWRSGPSRVGAVCCVAASCRPPSGPPARTPLSPIPTSARLLPRRPPFLSRAGGRPVRSRTECPRPRASGTSPGATHARRARPCRVPPVAAEPVVAEPVAPEPVPAAHQPAAASAEPAAEPAATRRRARRRRPGRPSAARQEERPRPSLLRPVLG